MIKCYDFMMYFLHRLRRNVAAVINPHIDWSHGLFACYTNNVYNLYTGSVIS